eukprot:m.178589 g.178589  ORF g.178589 m.178589 type:complete len:240 (+) comp18385_c0_seq21:59-778(+)
MLLYLLIGMVILLSVMRIFSSRVYDAIICSMTRTWYKAVLDRLSPSDHVLDVGIGTASSLLKNESIILDKNLTFVGVDYDAPYIAFAERAVLQCGLQDRVKVLCASIFDNDLSTRIKKGSETVFDAGYFSGSWTLMPSPVRALRIAASMIKPDGRIYVTQTFQKQSIPFLATVKPLLKYITTIDFGPLHFERDLDGYITDLATFENGVKLVVEENSVIPGSINNQFQSARMIVFKKVFQ